jgi:hypothetical protein
MVGHLAAWKATWQYNEPGFMVVRRKKHSGGDRDGGACTLAMAMDGTRATAMMLLAVVEVAAWHSK